jgi:hypothetical protein
MSRMTPEGRIKFRVRERVRNCSVPVYLFMPVQNGMGEATLDFIGCIGGRFFAIETKAGRGDMTPRQRHTKLRLQTAGATVFLLNEDPAGWLEFDTWLARMVAIVTMEQPEPPVPQLPQWAVEIINDGEDERWK